MSVAYRIDTLPGVTVLPGTTGAGLAAARDLHQFAWEGVLTVGPDFSLLGAVGAGGDAVATLMLPGVLPAGFAEALVRDGAAVAGACRDFHLPVRLGAQPTQRAPRSAEAAAAWRDYPVLVLDGWDDMVMDEARFVALVAAPTTGLTDCQHLYLTADVPVDVPVAELGGELPEVGQVAVTAPGVVAAGETLVALLDLAGDVLATYPVGPGGWAELLRCGGHLLVDARGRLELLGPRTAV